MPPAEEKLAALGSLKLFADVSRPELREIAHDLEEQGFPRGQKILRAGISGYNFYVIVEGEASVTVDGKVRARLSKGDFFGEISILLQDLPTADVTAETDLVCVYLPAERLRDWLVKHPLVMYRMLQDEAARVKSANEWQN